MLVGWIELTVVVYLIIVAIPKYPEIWHSWLQMDEPFTRWIARIRLAHKVQYFVIIGTLVLIALSAISFAILPHKYLGCIIFGFFCWFVPHIEDYIKDHPENTPDPPLEPGC